MSDRFVFAAWQDRQKLLAIIEATRESRPVDFVVFGSNANPSAMALIERALTAHRQADIVVVCDPNDPARQFAYEAKWPPLVSLLAASPTGDVATAVSIECLRKQVASTPELSGAEELTLRAAIVGTVQFIQLDTPMALSLRDIPQLTMPATGPRAVWLRDILVNLRLLPSKTDSPNSIALRAGLLLLNDFFHDSHSSSQSIEGHQDADYWHAILHRREPDYGNAKYWFRHVGRHAVFGDLAPSVATMFARATRSLAGKLDRWKTRLIPAGRWEPFAFVDLCDAAATDAELSTWCEEVQFVEMLQLLRATYMGAIG